MSGKGYRHPSYAAVFSDMATPRELPCSGGWILERSTPFLPFTDAMGCYPLFSCKQWSGLKKDLEALREDLVCISLVTDPFGDTSQEELQECFDKVVFYKDHYVTDLAEFPSTPPSKKTRRNLSKSLQSCDLEVCSEPLLYLDEWLHLYSELIERHEISGLRTFSRPSFEKLFKIPDLVMLRASNEGNTIGLHTWMVSGETAYGHLGATNQLGYELMASYALYWFAIETFRSSMKWLDLGAAPGNLSENESGLMRFKRRWATGTKPVYFCSRIFDENKYNKLMKASTVTNTHYFPGYRAGEFQ